MTATITAPTMTKDIAPWYRAISKASLPGISRPALAGVLVENDSTAGVTLTAADGFRLATVTLPTTYEGTWSILTRPSPALIKGDVPLDHESIDAKFPRHKHIIPDKTRYSVEIPISTITTVAKDYKRPKKDATLRLHVERTGLEARWEEAHSYTTADYKRIDTSEEHRLHINGECTKRNGVDININLLTDIAKPLGRLAKTDHVSFGWDAPTTQTLTTIGIAKVVIMPMRINHAVDEIVHHHL